ncbi:class I SAM-dependent methyltransferase [Peribacillus sp. YIM B13472]|uniref:class I SAM-dependent methyltransferase n=1 Tax=Peribacillus sp. YIM B13472 TaxID=3366297 RepID=UPI00366C93F9
MGCVTGRTTFALYKKGFQNITGINLTPDMLTEAEKIAMNITHGHPLYPWRCNEPPFSTTHHSKKQSSLLMI